MINWIFPLFVRRYLKLVATPKPNLFWSSAWQNAEKFNWSQSWSWSNHFIRTLCLKRFEPYLRLIKLWFDSVCAQICLHYWFLGMTHLKLFYRELKIASQRDWVWSQIESNRKMFCWLTSFECLSIVRLSHIYWKDIRQQSHIFYIF